MRNMAHDFRRVDFVVALDTGQRAWAWMESETDDYTGCMLMVKLRMLLTLPGNGFSEVIFVDGSRDDEPN